MISGVKQCESATQYERQKVMKPKLGIIGGMGTQATASFYEKLHGFQSVTTEQEYIDILLYSILSTPDRTAFITGKSADSPLEHLTGAAQMLESAGVVSIAIPCITSHYFYDELIKSVNIPILNMLDETAEHAVNCGIEKVCLLATDGTIKAGLFQAAFEKNGIEVTTPSSCIQAELMEMIYDIKKGELVTSDSLDNIIKKACENGAESVVLGCTELCVINSKTNNNQNNSINILNVLADAALAICKKVH